MHQTQVKPMWLLLWKIHLFKTVGLEPISDVDKTLKMFRSNHKTLLVPDCCHVDVREHQPHDCTIFRPDVLITRLFHTEKSKTGLNDCHITRKSRERSLGGRLRLFFRCKYDAFFLRHTMWCTYQQKRCKNSTEWVSRAKRKVVVDKRNVN